MSESTVVKAIYPFKGKNNDELNFKKGDVITITQKIDGGWWEGTLGEITGWFPSNYVCEIKDPNVVPYVHHDSTNLAIVYKDLVDSEKAHIDELQGLATNFLKPLERSTILTTDEFKQLCCNFQEVLETHQTLLKLVEDELQKPHKEQRIGRQFLHHATHMKNVHQAYCSLHPKAACIIDKYRDELTKYMESCGANSPGVLVLTTGLSKPFRRLAKYSGMLLEVERHVEGSHPDRGDIQRSVAVYKDIDMTCAATRRHKELELQVLTGPVRGWEGQSLSTLGDIIYMGSVAVGSQHLDRYFVLFASNLLILSVSHRLSAFIYEGKLPAAGMVVTRLEDSDQYKNAFEISCPMTDKVLAVCQSREEANHWVDLLRSYNSNRTTLSNSKVQSQAEIYPQPPPHMSTLVVPPNINIQSNVRTLNAPIHGTLNNNNNNNSSNNRGWSICMRPTPPTRPCTSLPASTPNHTPIRSSCSNRKPTTFMDDAHILEVIETYFALPKASVNSVKVQTDNGKSTADNINEFMRCLQKQLKHVEYNMELLSSQLNDERVARITLQNIMQKHLKVKEMDGVDWPAMESNIMS